MKMLKALITIKAIKTTVIEVEEGVIAAKGEATIEEVEEVGTKEPTNIEAMKVAPGELEMV